MSVITLDGEIIHYEVLGRGKPLIFLHGWVGSWRYWVPTMQAASISYRAYAIDLWGFGDTAKKAEMYTLSEQANLLNSFLEALGITKVALIGHGLGAIVAMNFADRWPQSVDRIMVTTFPLRGSAINSRLRTLPVNELAEWLLGKLPATEAARNEAIKTDSQAILTSLDDLVNMNLMEMPVTMMTPCLFVHGQNDLVVEVPPQVILDGLPEHAHYIIFDQSGHFPMLDEASKFNRLLFDFLSLGSGESPRQLQLKEEWKRRIR